MEEDVLRMNMRCILVQQIQLLYLIQDKMTHEELLQKCEFCVIFKGMPRLFLLLLFFLLKIFAAVAVVIVVLHKSRCSAYLFHNNHHHNQFLYASQC